MKVAVTGGAGFIGGYVCEQLHEAGHEPVVFDPRGKSSTKWEYRLGDVRDATAVTEIAAHVDAIIHLAAVLGTQETIANPRPAAETNVFGTINVLEACRQYRLPLVNITVGNWWMRNTYSTTKHCAERLVEQYRDELGLQAANVRCVNAYGPRQAAAPPFAAGKVRKIIPAFVCRALTGAPIEVYGDGEQISDCVYVEDVARVIVAAFEHAADKVPIRKTVEVGPIDHATVNGVARTVIRAAARITGTAVDIVHAPMRPGETVGTPVVADVSTLEQVDIDPLWLIPLEEGIDETVRWFHANRGITWE